MSSFPCYGQKRRITTVYNANVGRCNKNSVLVVVVIIIIIIIIIIKESCFTIDCSLVMAGDNLYPHK